MKLKYLVGLIITAGYIVLCSYKNGPGANGWDCTGAETGLGNVSGCKTCHGSTATSTLGMTIEFDSAGVPTTQYVGGGVYTVTISAINNSATSLPKYGFQMGCIQGATAVTTPINEGTWSALPASTHIANPSAGNFVVRTVEQTAVLTATTGTGGTGTTYSKTFTWTAPAAGTGTVSFWGVVNAVNGDGGASSADKWNTAHIAVTELLLPAGIAETPLNIGLSVFPNPVTNDLTIQLDQMHEGDYILAVYNLNGAKIFTKKIERYSSIATENINTSNWNPGIYELVIENNGLKKVAPVVKQ